MMDTPTPASKLDSHLQTTQLQLRGILDALSTFDPHVAVPPIIESPAATAVEDVVGRAQDGVKGLRAFRESVVRDLGGIEKFLADPAHIHRPAPSSNAPYLIAVWDEVVRAPWPVTAVWATFSEEGPQSQNSRGKENGRERGSRKNGNVRGRQAKAKETGVKVDVVADGGRQWIRVNTTKNSRLLAEFREIDSYLTDSEDGEASDGQDHTSSTSVGIAPSAKCIATLDNSILRTARSLLAAARANPLCGTVIPAVTLRLTRLDPAPADEKEYDPRIKQTIDAMREMGIDVQLGERCLDAAEDTLANSTETTRPPAIPTLNINLDLSLLIALVSDLTHAPLPTSAADAEARFTPSAEYIEWKKRRIDALKKGAPRRAGDGKLAEYVGQDGEDVIVRPARALVLQALQEMEMGLLQDVHDKLHDAHTRAGVDADGADPALHPSSVSVEFWTTPEAKERCLQIVAKIGGPQEKRRAESLFAADTQGAERDFWDGSRYPRGYVSLPPIRLFPSDQPELGASPPARTPDGQLLSPFFWALARTCRDVLGQDTMPHPRPFPLSSPHGGNGGHEHGDGDGEDQYEGEIQRASVTRANPRLTAHTVQSMLWGAVKGWTTLTANRSSVKAILREMRTARGGLLWDIGDEREWESQTGLESVDIDGDATNPAAIWMADPRSLAEGMRADYGMHQS